jgi:alkanesulfonate monooxygenase SsuD/methylene tetrahydromethanopterin reductase-like flavin-dependent oxidoreductase (luciferase family)
MSLPASTQQNISPPIAAKMRYSIFSVQDHHPHLSRTFPELYQQVIEQCELAETLSYDTFFVAEHHFHEYGAVPNPAVFLASLAQRTKTIKLGSAISILTFHNPLTIAENYSMVDVLSGGRLMLGVGSGYLKHEFEGYAIDGSEKRDRFDENLMIVKRAMRGERISFEGKYNTLREVAINVLPIQRPTPPIYVAILRKEAAYYIGRQGNYMLSVPYASVDNFEQVAEIVTEFRRGYRESGAPDKGEMVFAFHTHAAETDAEARELAAEAFDLYVATRLYAKRQTYDDILKSGLALFGSVDTVVNKLVRLHDMGIDHVMLLQNFGLLAPERVQRSMRLIAEEVMPRVNARIVAKEAA